MNWFFAKNDRNGNAQLPHFIISASAPNMLRWIRVLDRLQEAGPSAGHTVEVDVARISDNLVGYVSSMFNLLIAMQHYPDVASRMLHNIELRFIGDGADNTHQGIVTTVYQAQYLAMLGNLHALPVTTFFLKSRQHRFLAIKGDILALNKAIGSKEMGVITDRVFNASRHLMYYCYGLSIDTKPYVLELMELLKVSFSYERLLKYHIKDMKYHRLPKYRSITSQRRRDPLEKYLRSQREPGSQLPPGHFLID